MWSSPQGGMVAGFLQVSDPNQSKAEAQCLCDPASEVTDCHFCNILLVTQVNTGQCKEGPHGTMDTSKEGLLGAILEAGYHRDSVSSILGLPRQREEERSPYSKQNITPNLDTLFNLRRRKGHL